jgi:hypothetical protein
MADLKVKTISLELIPIADDELVFCADLYRTWLIESNPHGAKHEKYLRAASIGQLIKWMAAANITSGGRFSREALVDRIEAIRMAKQQQGGNAA